MDMFFFVTAMIMNIETTDITPKYNHSVFFRNKINCEVYVQQNYTTLVNGLQIYLDQQGDSGVVESIGCTGLTKEDLEEMFEEQQRKENTIST